MRFGILAGLCLMTMGGLTGCNYFASVGTTGGQIPKVKALPSPEGQPIPAALTLSYRKKLNDEPIEASDATAQAELQDRAIEAFEKSGFVKILTKDATAPQLNIKIDVLDEGRYNPRQRTATALTLYLYPSKSVDHFILNATITDSTGKQVGAYQMEDTVTQWQELFLAFGMPFANSQKVSYRLQDRFIENLIYRMNQDGLIK